MSAINLHQHAFDVLRDRRQSPTFQMDRVVRVDHEYVRRVEIGLLTVIAIRGRAVKGHSLAVLNAAATAVLR